MDDATAARLLATYGAQPTPGNVAAAKEFFASNPEVAEHRAMGMRGSVLDDNSDLFRGVLDRLMQQTATPTPQPAPSLVQQAPAATAPAAVPRGRMQQQAPSSAQYGPNLPMASGMVNPLDAPAGTTPPSDDNSMWKWLLPLLGVAAGQRTMGPNAPRGVVPYQGPEAEFVGRMPRGADAALQGQQGRIGGYTQMGQERIPGPQPQVPNARSTSAIEGQQRRIEDRTPRGNYESTGQEMETVRNRNDAARSGRERQLRAEVEDENAQAQRLMEQMRNRQRAQSNTAELLRAGRRAIGGR